MPEVFTPEPEHELDAEREALIGKLDQFIGILESDPKRTGLSIYFGNMTMNEWSRLHGAHWHHHLKLFGV